MIERGFHTLEMGGPREHAKQDQQAEARIPGGVRALFARLTGPLKFLLGIALLYLALRDVHIKVFLEAIRNLDRGWLGIVISLILAGLILKTWRWALLLSPVVPGTAFRDVLGVLLVGQAGNILLPLRGGDVVRTWLGSASDAGRVPSVATTVMIEKGLDALALAMAMALAFPLLPSDLGLGAEARGLLGFGLGALAAAIFAVLVSPYLWLRIREFLGHLPDAISKQFLQIGDRFAQGMAELRKSRVFLMIGALTILSWITTYGTNQALIYGFGLNLPFSAGLLVLVLVFLGIIPGLMPGQLGPFYFFARLALSQFGVGSSVSTAYAVVLHAFFLVPPLVGAGVYLLLSRGVSWRPR